MAAPQAQADVKPFKSAQAFEAWLRREHAQSEGLWLKIAKKGSGMASVSYPEAVDIALCWGWIDGQKKSFDDAYFLQRFTPRRPRSVWSKTNTAKVAALIEAGRMQAPGQAQVDAAQADGRWARAYDGARTATVPDELQAALTRCPPAQAFFSTLNASQRYAVIWRVQTAVRPETRARRVTELVEKLARGELVHIFKPKSPVQAAADSGSGS